MRPLIMSSVFISTEEWSRQRIWEDQHGPRLQGQLQSRAHEPQQPVTVSNLAFSFMDLDSDIADVNFHERVIRGGFDKVYLRTTQTSQTTDLPDGSTIFSSSTSEVCSECNNPTDPALLSPEQQARTVTLEFNEVSKFHFVVDFSTLVLGSCRARMAWKTAKSQKWKKNGNRNGKPPQAARGQKWAKKMAQKWIFEGVFHYFFHFWAIFLPFLPPCSLGAVFHFDFHFFFHFRLLAVFHAIPARQDPNIGERLHRLRWRGRAPPVQRDRHKVCVSTPGSALRITRARPWFVLYLMPRDARLQLLLHIPLRDVCRRMQASAWVSRTLKST